MDKFTEYYRKQFYQEAREILERVSNDTLRAEADPENHELLNAIFRGIHTIKGSAGSFELEEISAFAHHFEGLLSALRDGKISPSPEVTDIILAGSDHISRMIEDYEAGREPLPDPQLTERFLSFSSAYQDSEKEQRADSDKTAVPLPVEIPLPPEVQQAFQEAVSIGLYAFRVRLRYSSELLENGYDPLVFLQNLKRSCTFYHAVKVAVPVPEIKEFNPLLLYLYPTVYVATALTAGEISELTFDPALVFVEEVHIKIDELGSEPLHEFVDSAAEMLESLEKAVIEYETSGSRESLNEIFRVVHNFKGDADLIGLQEITVFAQTLESLLERLRNGTIRRTFALVDVILQSVDFLRQSVLKLSQGIKIPEFPPVFETLKQYAAMKEDLDRNQYLLKDISPDLREVFTEQTAQYKQILIAYGSPFPSDEEKQKIITRALKGLAKASAVVGLRTLRDQAEKALAAAGQHDIQTFSEVVERITSFIVTLGEEEPESEPAGRTVPDDAGMVRKKETEPESRTMRIDERKVDQFTNMVGELLIARNTYTHLLRQLETAEIPARNTVKLLKDNLHLFSRLTNDIHHGVMSLRMIPVGRVFQKFSRAVRDIARRQKKAIQLLTDGEDIEIDKKVADMLSDPLIHLVRNACDHGIEPPEERNAAGKPEKGTVIIRASQEGGNLYIRIIDDGRGIDRQRIYEKAREMSMDVRSPDDPSVPDMIFLPGLSTSKEISDISGRGVGLDVVKTTVRSLGGAVRVISNEGKGMEVTLSIPMTLGIDTVLFVEACGTYYAIPIEYIVETLKIPLKKIKKTGSKMFFYHRGEVLPAERLESLLNSGKQVAGSLQDAGEDCPVVIVKTVRGKCGLLIDRLDKNIEVAIKPLPGILAGIDIFSGVSIMGDGKVFLVLDPGKIFQESV